MIFPVRCRNAFMLVIALSTSACCRCASGPIRAIARPLAGITWQSQRSAAKTGRWTAARLSPAIAQKYGRGLGSGLLTTPAVATAQALTFAFSPTVAFC